MSYSVDCTTRIILQNSHILLFKRFWPFQAVILIFSSMLQDCSRHRIATHSLSVLSLFIHCDLRHNALWAFLFSNREKEEIFVTREMSVLLLINHQLYWLCGCSELIWLQSYMNKLPSLLLRVWITLYSTNLVTFHPKKGKQ